MLVSWSNAQQAQQKNVCRQRMNSLGSECFCYYTGKRSAGALSRKSRKQKQKTEIVHKPEDSDFKIYCIVVINYVEIANNQTLYPALFPFVSLFLSFYESELKCCVSYQR